MAKTIFGIFNNRDDAEEAINRLKDQDYNPKDMSIVIRDTGEARAMSEDMGANIGGGAVSGAATGGVIGAIAGLLIGVGAIAVPGIGALLIGGPLAVALGLTGAAATTVSGALTGVLAGGLVGALVSLGIPENEARVYEERVKSGAILLAVPARDGEEEEVRNIMEDTGATNVSTVSMSHDHYEHHRDEEERKRDDDEDDME